MSVNTNHVKNKHLELSELINRRLPEIVCLEETYTEDVYIENYKTFSKPMSQCPHGSVILVRTDFAGCVENIETEMVHILKVKAQHKELILVNVYQMHNKEQNQKYNDELKKHMENFESYTIIKIGDWNMTPKENPYVKSKTSVKHVNKPTRTLMTGNLSVRNIDYAYLTNDNNIKTGIKAIIFDISDHKPIELPFKHLGNTRNK